MMASVAQLPSASSTTSGVAQLPSASSTMSSIVCNVPAMADVEERRGQRVPHHLLDTSK